MRSFFILSSFFIAGCVGVPLVADDVMEPAIDTGNFKCTEPFELTQDCSSNSYALREISIDDQKIRIAASTAGDIVLVNSATPWHDCIGGVKLLNPFVWNCPELSKNANAAYIAVRDFLSDNGMKVRRAIPHTSFESTIGYYIILDSDGYELLKTLSNSASDDNSDDPLRPDRCDSE